MDLFLGAIPTIDRIGSVTAFLIIAFLVITEKLIWHKRFDKLREDRDKWQRIAIDALTGPAQAGVRAAEVAATVVSSLPDPADTATAGRD